MKTLQVKIVEGSGENIEERLNKELSLIPADRVQSVTLVPGRVMSSINRDYTIYAGVIITQEGIDRT